MLYVHFLVDCVPLDSVGGTMPVMNKTTEHSVQSALSYLRVYRNNRAGYSRPEAYARFQSIFLKSSGVGSEVPRRLL